MQKERIKNEANYLLRAGENAIRKKHKSEDMLQLTCSKVVDFFNFCRGYQPLALYCEKTYPTYSQRVCILCIQLVSLNLFIVINHVQKQT